MLQAARNAAPLYALASKNRLSIAKENIGLSFPELNENEVERLSKKSLRLWMEIFGAELFLVPKALGNTHWEERVNFELLPETERILRGDKPALLITGHMGNWEVLGWVLSRLGLPISAVARPLDNPLINELIESIRQAHGLSLISKFGATSVITNSMEKGNHIGFIADQNGGDKGIFVPFFGRLASTYKSIGLLALTTEAPVIVAQSICHRNPLKWTIRIVDTFGPDDWTTMPDPLYYITARFTRGIETAVRHNPAQYFWMHRRWKSRPTFEQRKEKAPKKLIQQLESLPWMTDNLINSTLQQS